MEPIKTTETKQYKFSFRVDSLEFDFTVTADTKDAALEDLRSRLSRMINQIDLER